MDLSSLTSMEYSSNESIGRVPKYTNYWFVQNLHSPFKIAVKYLDKTSILINVLKYTKKPVSATLTVHVFFYKKLSTTKMFDIKNWEDTIWQISMEVPSKFVNEGYERSLTFDLKWHDPLIINSVKSDSYIHTKDLLLNKQFSDVTIVIDGEEIPAHKFVLMYHSPVFFAMLNANMKENQTHRIEIKDVQLDIMKHVISFMYTGNKLLICEKSCDDICQILVVADMYEVNALIKLCEDELYKFFTVENILKIFHFASLCNLTNLRNNSIDFMLHRLHKITKTDEFIQLSHEHPDIFKDIVLAINKDESLPDFLLD